MLLRPGLALALALFSLVLIWGSCSTVRDDGPGANPPALAVRGLTTEHQVDPMGIDARSPRFSWKLQPLDPAARGLAQSAYQVLVASDEAHLARDHGDRWDSGRVQSSATVDVEYAGAELRSNERCVWKVRAWDQRGATSDWSEPARFSVGLLAPGDWSAKWIGFDAPAKRPVSASPFTGARWIWFGGDPSDAPVGERFFRARLDLTARPRTARLSVSVDNQWEVFVNGVSVHVSDGEDYAWRRPADVEVADQLVPGVNVIAVHARNTADGPAALVAKLALENDDGTKVELASDERWRASDVAGPEWTAVAFDDSAWTPAVARADYGAEPWGQLAKPALFLPPPRLLRKSFTVAAAPARATLYVSALGLCEVELGGARVGDALFTPGWTDYAKRVPTRAYDVTALVHAGDNALGATLADGWYAGYVGYGGRREHYGAKPRFLAELLLEAADGALTRVVTDGSWRASTGPLVEADFLMGERYDARAERDGWSEPGFDDASWSAVDVGADHAPVLGAHPGPPVRVVAEFVPKQSWSVGPDTWVCDFGQNVAGFARIAVEGAAGHEVVLRYAERLDPERKLYTANLRGARATDVYVCKGSSANDGVERWQPRFTFHGFQYVEVTGLGRQPDADSLRAIAVTSDVPYHASLTTSEPALDRLMENIRWTQRMNFIDVPTDCPQRDERLGWTGDAQVYARTAAWNADVQAFFAKWLVDLADAQRADGQFPMVAPLKVAGDDGGPAWADAGVICPWTMFEVYGDRRLLAQQYPSMQRFLDFCAARAGDDCLPPAEFHCFGDWVSVGPDTPKEVIATAYFARCAKLMERSAAALGLTADASKYAQLFERVRKAFDQAYVDAEGKIRGDTQCAYALALAFDLLDGARKEKAAQRLVADVEARGGHFSTGFVGTKDLLLALNEIGRADLAYRMLMGRDYPGWRFEIDNGATSIWERWDGWTPEKGFQDPGMNSFAHYAFGAVGEWMFATIGGLGADRPGFEHLLLRPQPGGGLTRATARYESIRGWVELEWKLAGDALHVAVRVPPNVGATLVLPTRDAASVTEGGQPLARVNGVHALDATADEMRVELLSGRYAFTCRAPVLAEDRASAGTE